MTDTLQNRCDWALDGVRRAGANALSYFDRGIAVEWKADASPVTLADQSTEQLLREEIGRLFPGDGFVGEEFGDQPGTTGYRWVIDPVDGTRNFIRGVPIWGTLVALKSGSEVVAGFVAIPALGQFFHAVKGAGAYRDGRRLQVSKVGNLKEALVIYTSVTLFQKEGRERQFLNLVAACDRTRGFGDFFGFTQLAEGHADVAIDSGVHEWDVAPLKVLVEEAGGRFTDWTDVPRCDVPQVLATNGLLHGAVLEIVNGKI